MSRANALSDQQDKPDCSSGEHREGSFGFGVYAPPAGRPFPCFVEGGLYGEPAGEDVAILRRK